MIHSIIDYYLIFLVFFLTLIFVLMPNKMFSFKLISRIDSKKILVHYRLNLTKALLKIFKVAIFFVFIFFVSGCKINSNQEITSDLLFKNFFILSKITFFILFFIFLIIFEYYIKIVNWFKSDVVILLYVSFLALYLIFNVDNFFSFYLILEMYSLSIIGCLALKKTKIKTNIESILKYFFINAISSCFILFGNSILYANSALNNFLDFRFFFWMFNNHPNFLYCNLGILFFMLGLLIKLSAFPFNYWFLDVYNNISTIFTLFLLIFPKFVFSCFMFTFVILLSTNNYLFNNIILYFSLATFLVNIFISFYQTKIKKLFIVTSFSNLPFYILFVYLKNFNSLIAFFGFSFIYYLNLFAVFIFLMFFVNLKSKNGIFFKKITSLNNLYRTNKKLSYMLSLFLLSIAGFPPLSGFFGKFYFLSSLITSNNFILFYFFSIMNLLVIYVYLRIIKIIFQSKDIYSLKFISINSRLLLFLFILLFLLNITAIFYFDIIFNFIKFFLLCIEWTYYI